MSLSRTLNMRGLKKLDLQHTDTGPRNRSHDSSVQNFSWISVTDPI